jgi:hypothetical protein
LLTLGGDDVLYRGHSGFDWDLSTTIERALLGHAENFDEHKFGLMRSMAADTVTEKWAKDVEDSLTHRFRQQALRSDVASMPALWDILGWWEVMQHHGAPTRLMDWSASPFIGLWFAIEHHNVGSGDMALWVYSRSIPAVNLGPVMARVKSHDAYETLDDRRLQNLMVRFAIDEELMFLVPVKPRPFQRAIAQQSILTVSPNIGVARGADWWVRQRLATRIRIKEEWKPNIQAACRSMGFSRASLFRDLDSIGASVSRDFVGSSYVSGLGMF